MQRVARAASAPRGSSRSLRLTAGWSVGFAVVYAAALWLGRASRLEGTGKSLRHVKLRRAGDLSAAVEALLRAAISEQARRLGL